MDFNNLLNAELFYHRSLKIDGKPLTAKRAGWNRLTLEGFKIPIRGLYNFGYITNENAQDWTT